MTMYDDDSKNVEFFNFQGNYLNFVCLFKKKEGKLTVMLLFFKHFIFKIV